MKTRNLILTICATLILCAGLAGCGKDEPKPGQTVEKEGLAGLEPQSEPTYDYEVYDKIFTHGFSFGNMSWWTTQEHVTEMGYFFGYMLDPVVDYKIYTLKDGTITDTGLKTSVCTADIINMYLNRFNFDAAGKMNVTSTTASGQPASQSLTCTYTYKDGKIKFTDIKTSDISQLVAYPLIVTSKDLYPYGAFDGTQWIWTCDAIVKEDPAYCIKLGENPHAVKLLTSVAQFLEKNAGSEMSIQIWNSENKNGKVYCSVTPEPNFCRTFCVDVLLPFLDDMSENSEVDEFRQDVTKYGINQVRNHIVNDSGKGLFIYSTSYSFTE